MEYGNTSPGTWKMSIRQKCTLQIVTAEATVAPCCMFSTRVGINKDAFRTVITIQTIMYLVSSNKCIPHIVLPLLAKHPERLKPFIPAKAVIGHRQ